MRAFIKKLVRLMQMPFVLRDYFRFARSSDERFSLALWNAYPCLKDKTMQTGFDRHYVYHTAWAARVLQETKPETHTDIASSLYFSAIVSAFVPTTFYDYRPAKLELQNLTSERADLTQLPFPDNSVKSLSCMHTVEHVGLGRYGDPVDPEGDIKAARELSRVLAPGGSLLFVAPIGKNAVIEFNAHRIYTYEAVLELFPELTLSEFSLIPEHEKNGGLIRNAEPAVLENEHYACGCFHFTKPI